MQQFKVGDRVELHTDIYTLELNQRTGTILNQARQDLWRVKVDNYEHPSGSLSFYESELKLIKQTVNIGDLKVKIKKLHPNAVIPTYAKSGDAGLDLTAVSKEYNEETGNVEFGLGLAIEVPENHVALLFPRSSIHKTPLTLANAVGVIDSGYRGELKAIFRIEDRPRKNYEIGDRVVQMIVLPFPKVEFEEVVELSDTERGSGGFGSSGN